MNENTPPGASSGVTPLNDFLRLNGSGHSFQEKNFWRCGSDWNIREAIVWKSLRQSQKKCLVPALALDLILFHFQPLVACKKRPTVSDKFELICPYSDSGPSSRQVQFENSSLAPVLGTHGSRSETTSRRQTPEKTSIWSLSICQKAAT